MTLAGLTLLTYERECLVYDFYLKKTNLREKFLKKKMNKKTEQLKTQKKAKKNENFNYFLKSASVSVMVSTQNLEDMELIKALYAMNMVISGLQNKIVVHVPGKSLKPKQVLLQVKGDVDFSYDLLGSLVFKYNPRLLHKQLSLNVDVNSLGIIFISFHELNVLLNASKYFDFFGWKNRFGVAVMPALNSQKFSKLYLSSLNL